MLDKNEEFCIITNDTICYNWAPQILNLLAVDWNYPNVKEQILNAIKYFKKNLYTNACFKPNPNACKLIVPSGIQWN